MATKPTLEWQLNQRWNTEEHNTSMGQENQRTALDPTIHNHFPTHYKRPSKPKPSILPPPKRSINWDSAELTNELD